MTLLPRILVIDDLIGKEDPEPIDSQTRADYCRSLGLWDDAINITPPYPAVARAHIVSGQVRTMTGLENSTSRVAEVFRTGWPDIAGEYWAAALVDMNFGDDPTFGLRIISLLHELAPELPAIVVSSLNQLKLQAGETLRHAAERLGAQDFLAVSGVDFDVEPEHRSTPENLEKRLETLGLIPDPEQQVVGKSIAVCLMLRSIRALIPSDVVGQALLLGEAGSGKSHLLGYVHRNVARVQRVAASRVRCQTITLAGTGEDMQSKALFGTTEATGVKQTPGAFYDVRDGGVLFLDEIGELAGTSQSDLLGALQPLRDENGRYRDVRRMGAREGSKSRCFVLAATNRDLEVMVEEGKFNEALLQRFANREVRVPPLRERKTDLPLLVQYFVEAACKQYAVTPPKLEISRPQWEEYADSHAVRELGALIENAISRNRFKTLLTERDVFGSQAQTRTRERSLPESRHAQGATDVAAAAPAEVVSTPSAGTVTELLATIGRWNPATYMESTEFDSAFVRMDAALAAAKLRLWRHMAERQLQFAGKINLLETARQLLGRKDIVNSKSGDLATQTFDQAGVGDTPTDPILRQIWDRRRLPKSPKKTAASTEDEK